MNVIYNIPKPNCKKYIQFGSYKINLYDAYICCLPKLKGEKINDVHVQEEDDTISNSSKISINSSSSNISEEIQNDTNEIDDEFKNMNDKDLINRIKSLLEECHKYKISDYYKINKIKYRAFNLSSLYSERNGMTDYQRIKIRDMARKCVEFLECDFVSIQMEKEREKITKRKKELDEQLKLINAMTNSDSE